VPEDPRWGHSYARVIGSNPSAGVLCERIQQRARDAPSSPAILDRYAVTTFDYVLL
jgi:uncharacterized NAD-dependent epimerase/dehydratase family protein